MMSRGIIFILFLISILFLSRPALASDSDLIELPMDELAKESVTPIFDKNQSTKNRNIITEKKIDLNVFYGWALTEPIASVSKLGLTAYYHTSEDSAWGLLFAKTFAGVSNYAEQLKKQYSLDFSRAPAPEFTLMVDYNLKAFYGKMSLTKKNVLNMHVLGTAAGGLVKYQHKSYPAVALGVGQKFYFSKAWALRLDLRVFAHNAPIPFLANKLKTSSSPPSYTDFEERMNYIYVLDVGMSYLF